MAVLAPISVEEYLENPTEPESEYLDGELFQKAMGTNLHSRLQGRLIVLLNRFQERGLGQVVPEQSIRVRPGAVLIPDVAVLIPDNAEDGVITSVPLLCIEILSPSDRFSYTVRKCEEYTRCGVPACWIFDPVEQRAWISDVHGLKPVAADGTLTAGEISLSMAEIFPGSKLIA